MAKTALFGPAGNSNSFYERGYKSFEDVPRYTVEMGLDTFEYQCGRGVKIKTDNARLLGEHAAQAGITMSVHAPYYISLASMEEQKRKNSARYLLESAEAVTAMGGRRMVMHPGSLSGQSRAEAFAVAQDTLLYCLRRLDEAGYQDVTVCPETMGKLNQLGDLEEIIAFCLLDERLVPCIDFGHLNARSHGGIKTKDDYAAVLDALENKLGKERAGSFHSHFSKIEYSTGGERRHLTFSDTVFGPDPCPLLELVAERGLTPTFICESDGTQAEDAADMKRMYQEALARQ